MAISVIRILVRIDFPSMTIRLWDGAGPYLDANGDLWRGSVLTSIDQIEAAINAEATMFRAGLSAVTEAVSNTAWEELDAGDVVGSRIQLLIQPCDEHDQPDGGVEVRSTATIDNVTFDEQISGSALLANVVAECVNRFNLRNLTSGSVLSDVDQRARSARLNPGADPDRFGERVPLLADHTIAWPNLS